MRKCYRAQILTSETNEKGIPVVTEPMYIAESILEIQKVLKPGEDFIRAQDQGWNVPQKEIPSDGDWWLLETSDIYLIKAVNLEEVYRAFDAMDSFSNSKNIKAVSKIQDLELTVI